MNDVILAALAISYRKVDDGYEFLLLQHQNGTWTFPGGGMEEADQSLEDCLLRELEEEIGLKLSKNDIKDTGLVNTFTYDSKKPDRQGKTGETHFYLLKLSGNEELSSWDKISDHGWFPADKILALLPFEGERNIFQKAVATLD